MLSSLGTFGSYGVAAVAFVAFALATAILLRKRRQPAAKGGPGTRTLEGMNARDFEALVRESFRLQGYKLIDAPRGVPAGGELMLRRDRETVLVQCKHWRDSKVGVEVVQSMQRAMAARGAGGGFVLTAGRFKREAVAFAAGCNVRLIDGPALHGLIEKANRSTTPAATL